MSYTWAHIAFERSVDCLRETEHVLSSFLFDRLAVIIPDYAMRCVALGGKGVVAARLCDIVS